MSTKKLWLLSYSGFLITFTLTYWLTRPNRIELRAPLGQVNWNRVDFSRLPVEQIMEYVQWTNHESCQVFHDFGGAVVQEPAGIDGQKSVCLDAGVAPSPGHCLVYSFGINNEWSFDETMERYGCDVFAFDPSMNEPSHNHSLGVHFYPWGLANQDSDSGPNGWKVRTLSSIYNSLRRIHGDVVIDYLKIDIEYGEWPVIPQIIRSGMLDQIRQIGLEIHLSCQKSIDEQRIDLDIIKSLELNGMVRFNSRLNPSSKCLFQALDTDAYFAHEIAWYNSRFHS